jgi:4a-hydroxytetrahydrobiopterin dehydratase
MLTLQEINDRMGKLKDWTLEGSAIVKQLEFNDFLEAMDYVNKVAELAHKNNHHPDIFITYNMVRLTLTTHSAQELTEMDFKVASEIDQIDQYEESQNA